MSGRLDGKVAIVTGAASGIGAATARRFAAEGASLVLADADAGGVREIAGEIGGDRIDVAVLDVTDAADCAAVVAQAEDRRGRLDVLVNSAGISGRAVAGLEFEAGWDRVMAVNLKGTMLMCHAAVAAMRRAGGGAIVNLASVMGLVVHRDGLGLSDGFNPYPHSKGAVVQLTRDLGVHLAREGIRANAVCPGFVYTPLTSGVTDDAALHESLKGLHPMGRLAEADEIANVVTFLASDEASFVTAAAWPVDGGYTAI